MSLLREIQSSLLEPDNSIGPILLKLRFLAARLDSDVLQEWVRHESEGYPSDANVPSYRRLGISYTATFSGAFGSGIRNAPIPPYLIEKFAGKDWNEFRVRQSVTSIDGLIKSSKDEGTIRINSSNLILLLQGNLYSDMACNNVTGTMSTASFIEIQNSVRSRVLELTLEIERAMPSASDIVFGPPVGDVSASTSESVAQITNQIVYGNYTSISNTGSHANFRINSIENIGVGDRNSLTKALVDSGISSEDAEDFAQIVCSEKGINKNDPLGQQAKEWIVKNIVKAANGTWKVGISVATSILTEAAMRYYGLK